MTDITTKEEVRDERKFVGFNAEPDVLKFIQLQNDTVYRRTGRTNQGVAINELIRLGAQSKGWK